MYSMQTFTWDAFITSEEAHGEEIGRGFTAAALAGILRDSDNEENIQCINTSDLLL